MKAPFLRAGSKEHAFTHLTLRSLSLSLATDREEEEKKPNVILPSQIVQNTASHLPLLC